jgi:hypothetical protein
MEQNRNMEFVRVSAAYENLDEALDSISSAGPELANGLTNHAPMAIEALCALGRGDAVGKWLDHYRPRLIERSPHRQRIDTNWHTALGRLELFSDWQSFFENELQESSWTEVLDRWMTRLAPGFSASATHGPIRVGHAVRALSLSVTSVRLHEFAGALAYWASTYQTLPSDLSPRSTIATPREAIRNVPIIPAEKRRFHGSITSSLEVLDEIPEFASVIGIVDLSGDEASVLSELTETFAAVYAANARDVLSTIVLIHGVTSLAATRNITPHVRLETRAQLLRYAWQSASALYAAFGERPEAEFEMPHDSFEALTDAAIATNDEHAIKFIEACARENAIQKSPLYPVAARHAVTVLGK